VSLVVLTLSAGLADADWCVPDVPGFNEQSDHEIPEHGPDILQPLILVHLFKFLFGGLLTLSKPRIQSAQHVMLAGGFSAAMRSGP
jgi:hypothetical protein